MKKYKYLIIIGLILIISGVSYAFFSFNKTGDNNYSIAGNMYVYYENSDNLYISTTNIFPTSREEALERTNNYLDFSIKGIDTSNKNDVYYTFTLLEGDSLSGRERIDLSYLRFELSDITDSNNPVVLVTDMKYDSFNTDIYTNLILKETNTLSTKNYRLRVWLMEDILISDTEDGCDFKASSDVGTPNYTYPLYSNLFGSFKIKVTGGITDFNPNSFSTDSWETISLAAKSGNTSAYSIGDTKSITLTDNTTYTVRLVNKTSCDGTIESQTGCGFILDFTEVIENKPMMNELNDIEINSYENSDLREYLNTTFFNKLPNDLKSVITTTKVLSSHYDSVIATTYDKIFLLNFNEVIKDYSDTEDIDDLDAMYNKSRTLDYYNTFNTTIYNYTSIFKPYGDNTSYTYYWTRNMYNNSSYFYKYMIFNHNCNGIYASSPFYSIGYSPSFKLN